MNKTNHNCKNPKCNKAYYACDACDEVQGLHWRSVACSVDCFKEFIKLLDQKDNSEDC